LKLLANALTMQAQSVVRVDRGKCPEGTAAAGDGRVMQIECCYRPSC